MCLLNAVIKEFLPPSTHLTFFHGEGKVRAVG